MLAYHNACKLDAASKTILRVYCQRGSIPLRNGTGNVPGHAEHFYNDAMQYFGYPGQTNEV